VLAQDWQVLNSNSGLLVANPNDVCDPSSTCGPNPANAFTCTDVRRLEDFVEVNSEGSVKRRAIMSDCQYKCDDIEESAFREACELDVFKSGGDPSWACQDSYRQPLLEEANQCDFVKLGDPKCAMNDDNKCALIGGECVVDCENQKTDDSTCLAGLCSSIKVPKNGKASKASKGQGTSVPGLKEATKNDCMCLVPVVCSSLP